MSETIDSLGPGQIRLRVHGPDVSSEEVSASVFANKLRFLVRALRAADRAVNGKTVYDYTIAKLSSSAPTVVLTEREMPRKMPTAVSSGIGAFDQCVKAVVVGERELALRYGDSTVKNIERLAGGPKHSFGYAELWMKTDDVIRVDPFLEEQARSVIKPQEIKRIAEQKWFRGAAHGSFNGTIEFVDLRGALPEIKLILSAGYKQIDCVCRAGDIETIRQTLHKPVRVYGRAIYDGKSGLPRRIEVADIVPNNGQPDFSKWAGKFEHYPPLEWEEEQ